MTDDAEQKIRKYCSYQERCSSEVIRKLAEYGIRGGKAARILQELHQEGYVDDRRFAMIFAGGKFRHNRWGRYRIRMELTSRSIPGPVVAEALQEIPEEAYHAVLEELITRKAKEIPPEKKLTGRNKLFNFAVRKGFEEDLVLDVLNKLKF